MLADFVEGLVLLLPVDAGGRLEPITPRDGSYRATVGSLPVRFIEGPPSIEPGSSALVVIELEAPLVDEANFAAGNELKIIEDERVVGFLTVTRLWRRALAAV
jgi:hypothetical protein